MGLCGVTEVGVFGSIYASYTDTDGFVSQP